MSARHVVMFGFARGRAVALALLLLAGLAFEALTAPAVLATKGVAIDLGRVTVREPLRPGDALDLPAFEVMNPGDEVASYVMSVGALGGEGFAPESGWFTFSPGEFSLQPGASQRVRVQLNLPGHVDPGTYAGLIRAELAADGSGALIGGAAAAQLRFDVADTDLGLVVLPTAALALVGLFVAFVWLIRRRYRFTVHRR